MAKDNFYMGSFFHVDLGVEILGIGAIPGLTFSGDFTQVTGLGTEFSYETYCEGGSGRTAMFYAGVVPQMLILERGVIKSIMTDILQYCALATKFGSTITMTGSIKLLDPAGTVIRKWSINGATLVKYSGPSFDANKSFIAVEKMEFIYNGSI